MATYHTDLGVPASVTAQVPAGPVPVVPTRHAERAAQTDRYGYIPIPRTLDFRTVRPFEFTVEGGHLVKVAVRAPRDARTDACYVLANDGDGYWVLITCWANERTDTHRTLNVRRYTRT